MSSRFSRTIYVGNLPSDIKEYEIEDLFYKVYVVILSYFYHDVYVLILRGDVHYNGDLQWFKLF